MNTLLASLKDFLAKPELQHTSRRTPLGHDEVDFFLKGGLQHGSLHEVFSVMSHEAAATGFVAGLAKCVAADKHVLWIGQDFSAHEWGELSAIGLWELGIDPAHLLLLSVANASDILRAANDALSCAALGAVVIEIPGHPKILDMTASRRLSLLAAQNQVTTFLLRFAAQPRFNTAHTRWLVRGSPSPQHRESWGRPFFQVELVRNRQGKTGEWMMEWSGDESGFREPKANLGAVVSAAVNGSTPAE